MQQILDYFAGLDIWGWLEILAMIVGIYYVYLEIRKTRLLWYVCILTSVLNIFVYGHNSFLSMAVIQVYYIVMAFYGLHAFKELGEDAAAENAVFHRGGFPGTLRLWHLPGRRFLRGVQKQIRRGPDRPLQRPGRGCRGA